MVFSGAPKRVDTSKKKRWRISNNSPCSWNILENIPTNLSDSCFTFSPSLSPLSPASSPAATTTTELDNKFWEDNYSKVLVFYLLQFILSRFNCLCTFSVFYFIYSNLSTPPPVP